MYALTKKQQKVCDLLVKGYSTKEAARSLGYVTHRTVENHRAAVLSKYNVRNVVELIRAVYNLDALDHAEGDGSPERPFTLTHTMPVIPG